LKKLFAAAVAWLALSGVALAQPPAPSQLPSTPTRPPSKPPTGPPSTGGMPRPPSYRPPIYRDPNPWRRPTSSQWYWHGRWVGRIHGPAFVYPPGYAYRRWYRGDRLPAVFLTATYFYGSVARLGLQSAPAGYRWIRYGSDLLLVDVVSGRIEDVAYGVFY
jgi:Ni/Co efflux regulator RcnB